jgi:hypothetical protein
MWVPNINLWMQLQSKQTSVGFSSVTIVDWVVLRLWRFRKRPSIRQKVASVRKASDNIRNLIHKTAVFVFRFLIYIIVQLSQGHMYLWMGYLYTGQSVVLFTISTCCVQSCSIQSGLKSPGEYWAAAEITISRENLNNIYVFYNS